MTTKEIDDLRKELADLKSLVSDILNAIYAAARAARRRGMTPTTPVRSRSERPWRVIL